MEPVIFVGKQPGRFNNLRRNFDNFDLSQVMVQGYGSGSRARAQADEEDSLGMWVQKYR